MDEELEVDEFGLVILTFMVKADRPLHKDFIISRCGEAIMRYGTCAAAIAAIKDGSFPIADV